MRSSCIRGPVRGRFRPFSAANAEIKPVTYKKFPSPLVPHHRTNCLLAQNLIVPSTGDRVCLLRGLPGQFRVHLDGKSWNACDSSVDLSNEELLMKHKFNQNGNMLISILLFSILLYGCTSATTPAATKTPVSQPVSAPTTLTIMTFNIWGGGANTGKPVDETVAAIRAAGADIIGLQETRLESDPCTAESCPPTGESAARAVAEALGFYYYDQTQVNAAVWANAIISRYPIGAATKNDLGVAIDVAGRTVYAYNIHFTDFPYQPYQLLNIEYGNAPFLNTAEEAVQAAQTARSAAVNLLLEDVATADNAAAVFIFGDFNEPSHRDWTEAAVAAGRHPVAVRWPTTLALETAGFVDALRTVFPDEVTRPAFTWTPTSDPADPEDHHDRIDFVFVRGNGLVVEAAAVVGEKSPEADIVVTPWPSDHRAVSARVTF